MDEILIEQYTHQENIIKSRVSTTQYLEDVIHTHTHTKKITTHEKIEKCGSQSREKPISSDKSTKDPDTGITS